MGQGSDEDELGGEENQNNDNNAFDSFLSSRIQDETLVVVDILAIAIAAQLIGLLDVVNNPEFIQNGGWFQPIPAIPPTLNVLIQRFSILTISWMTVALLFRKDSFVGSGSGAGDDESSITTIQTGLRILLDFTILRLVVGILFFFVGATGGIDDDPLNLSFVLLQLLRDCYFVGLSVTGFRFLYGRLIRW